ncbi:hypothetical protein [Mesorhizobium sp. WSM4307]|uniref:hypothetical protein n=2 Tax=Mesorhizobium TaxID=68287 RepID=UPI00115E057F|nr:hypothetical protein [Mesorhizobium sp. WSM4307]
MIDVGTMSREDFRSGGLENDFVCRRWNNSERGSAAMSQMILLRFDPWIASGKSGNPGLRRRATPPDICIDAPGFDRAAFHQRRALPWQTSSAHRYSLKARRIEADSAGAL